MRMGQFNVSKRERGAVRCGCGVRLHVHVLVHFFEPVFALLLLLPPLHQAARRLALDPVRDRRKDDEEPEKALRAHLRGERARGTEKKKSERPPWKTKMSGKVGRELQIKCWKKKVSARADEQNQTKLTSGRSPFGTFAGPCGGR